MGILDDAIREHLDLKRRHGADPTEMEQLEREALGPVRRGPDDAEDLPQGVEAEAAPYDESAPPEWSETPPEEDFLPEPESSLAELDTDPSLAAAAEPSPAEEAEPSLAEEPEPSLAEEPHFAPPSQPSGPELFDFEADTEAPRPAPEPPAGELPSDPADLAPAPAPDPAAAPESPEPAPPAPEPPDHLEEETAEYDVEAEHAQDRRGAGESPEAEGHTAPGQAGEDVLEETPEFLQDTPDHDRLWFEQRPPRDFDFEE